MSQTQKTKFFWKEYSDPLITAVQVFSDFLAVFLGFWIGYFVYVNSLGGLSPQSVSEYFWVALSSGILYVLIFRAVGLYERELSLLNIAELKKILLAAVWASFFFFGVTFYWRSVTFSRVTMTISMVSALFFVYLERLIFYRVHLSFHLRGLSSKRVLIYGAGEVGKHLLKRVYHSPSLGLAPVGLLDDDASKRGQKVLFSEFPRAKGNVILGGFKELESVVKSSRVEEVLIAIPSAGHHEILKIVQECRRIGVSFAIVPHAYDLLIERLVVGEVGGIPVLRIRQYRQTWIFHFFKRLSDLVGALVLLGLLAPLYLFFGILIRLDSSGPVIFKQKRVGLGGKEFSFYKFRTMYVDAPVYAQTPTSTQDPRITRVGRWLRRSSLDELPQLFNVLRGDMSFVGPRPEMPFIVATYNDLQRERLSVKPGITGVWQISAVRGEPIHANLEYDLFYIENQSLALDLVILFKTVFGVIRGIGAV